MAADLKHPSFPQPSNASIPLWRYMDISKFAALIQTKCLAFARSDNLGDPFEGSLPKANWAATEVYLKNRKSPGFNDPMKDVSDESIRKAFGPNSISRRKFRSCTYVSCWHMNESESMAMWKLYSRSSDSVCILTDYETLAKLLPENSQIGLIKYIDYNKDTIHDGNMFNSFMVKRKSFEHEREVRAIILDGDIIDDDETPLVKIVRIDIKKLIKKIYISPDAPEWFRDVVDKLSKKYGLNVPVQHSELNAVPLL